MSLKYNAMSQRKMESQSQQPPLSLPWEAGLLLGMGVQGKATHNSHTNTFYVCYLMSSLKCFFCRNQKFWSSKTKHFCKCKFSCNNFERKNTAICIKCPDLQREGLRSTEGKKAEGSSPDDESACPVAQKPWVLPLAQHKTGMVVETC